MTAHRYVVAYDVADTRRRNRIAAVLAAHGDRLQKSVFEMVIDSAGMDNCLTSVRSLLDREEDSLAVYRICRGCAPHRRYFGQADDGIADEEVFIV